MTVSVFDGGKQDAQMLLYQNLLDSRCKYLANEKLDAFSFFQATSVNTRINKESIASHVRLET